MTDPDLQVSRQDLIRSYNLLVGGIEEEALDDEEQSYGGVIRAAKGKLVEEMSLHIIRLTGRVGLYGISSAVPPYTISAQPNVQPANLCAPDRALLASFPIAVLCRDTRRLSDAWGLHRLLYGRIGFDPILPLPMYFRSPLLDCPAMVFLYSLTLLLYSLALLSDSPDILLHFPYFVVKKHDYLHQSERCE